VGPLGAPSVAIFFSPPPPPTSVRSVSIGVLAGRAVAAHLWSATGHNLGAAEPCTHVDRRFFSGSPFASTNEARTHTAWAASNLLTTPSLTIIPRRRGVRGPRARLLLSYLCFGDTVDGAGSFVPIDTRSKRRKAVAGRRRSGRASGNWGTRDRALLLAPRPCGAMGVATDWSGAPLVGVVGFFLVRCLPGTSGPPPPQPPPDLCAISWLSV